MIVLTQTNALPDKMQPFLIPKLLLFPFLLNATHKPHIIQQIKNKQMKDTF